MEHPLWSGFTGNYVSLRFLLVMMGAEVSGREERDLYCSVADLGWR